MRISVVGTGYVGLVVGTCLAETGNTVCCVDVDEKKIRTLRRGRVPIYEPALEEMIRRNVAQERLRFSTDLAAAVRTSLIVFIAVGTPPEENGSSDLRHVLDAAHTIAGAMNGYKIIVNKSTVPVGTADRVREEISARTRFSFEVVSNPEFLKEGAAIEDFMKPDRVIIGLRTARAEATMKELYAPFTRTGAPILVMDPRSAEMTKYAANAMLASRISFMNEIANLCEHVGADVRLVRQGIGTDHRIGSSFLFSGVGYGGSCFPKDIKALIGVAREKRYPLKLIRAVEDVNEVQKYILVDKVLRFFASKLSARLERQRLAKRASGRSVSRSHNPAPSGSSPLKWLDASEVPSLAFRSRHSVSRMGAGKEQRKIRPLQGKTFAVWGLSFKPQTDDMREASSTVIIERLLELGARIQVYDPEAIAEARKRFGRRIHYAKSDYGALKQADALILVTEWNEFRNPDFQKMKRLLKYPVIFDGRNQYNTREMRELGFLYFGIGVR